MVEVALSLLLLCTILFGITEFGRAMYIMNTLNFAAREGARRASVSSTTPLNLVALQTLVSECIPFDKTGLGISITPAAPAHGVDTITVVVTLPFSSMVALIPQLDGIILSGEASMRYE